MVLQQFSLSFSLLYGSAVLTRETSWERSTGTFHRPRCSGTPRLLHTRNVPPRTFPRTSMFRNVPVSGDEIDSRSRIRKRHPHPNRLVMNLNTDGDTEHVSQRTRSVQRFRARRTPAHTEINLGKKRLDQRERRQLRRDFPKAPVPVPNVPSSTYHSRKLPGDDDYIGDDASEGSDHSSATEDNDSNLPMMMTQRMVVRHHLYYRKANFV